MTTMVELCRQKWGLDDQSTESGLKQFIYVKGLPVPLTQSMFYYEPEYECICY